MELDALPQLESPNRAVLVGRPAFRQNRLGGEIGARQNKRFRRLRYDRDAAAVRDLDRIQGRRWDDLGNANGAAEPLTSAATPPRNGKDRPRTEPWRMNSRRLTRPATNPSMR